MNAETFRYRAGLGEHKTIPPWMFKARKGNHIRTIAPTTVHCLINHVGITLELRLDTANIKVREGREIIGVWSGNPVHAQSKLLQIKDVLRRQM